MENSFKLFKAPDARYKLLTVTPELLLEGTLFNTRVSHDGKHVQAILTDPPLPEDCRVEALSYDPMTRLVWLRLWSSEFPLSLEGCAIPQLNLTFSTKLIPVDCSPAKPINKIIRYKEVPMPNGDIRLERVEVPDQTQAPTWPVDPLTIIDHAKQIKDLSQLQKVRDLCDELIFAVALRVEGYSALSKVAKWVDVEEAIEQVQYQNCQHQAKDES